MNNEIITVSELTKILKISRSKAYKLVNSPGFPAIRIDKNIRIRKSDFNKWLNNLSTHDIFYSNLKAERG